MKREAVPEIVRSCMTGRMITPEYVKRTKVEAVVPDSTVKIIVDMLNDISSSEAHGMIFVKDVSDAYEIGTKVEKPHYLLPSNYVRPLQEKKLS
jgi:nitrogen regulatory protein PII